VDLEQIAIAARFGARGFFLAEHGTAIFGDAAVGGDAALGGGAETGARAADAGGGSYYWACNATGFQRRDCGLVGASGGGKRRLGFPVDGWCDWPGAADRSVRGRARREWRRRDRARRAARFRTSAR